MEKKLRVSGFNPKLQAMLAPARSQKARRSQKTKPRKGLKQARSQRIQQLLEQEQGGAGAATLALRGRRVRFETDRAGDLLDALAYVYAEFAVERETEGVRRLRARREEPTETRVKLSRDDAGAHRMWLGRKKVWTGPPDAHAEAVMALDDCAAGHLLPSGADDVAVLHGSCVELTPSCSVLLLAPSGSGKSVLTSALLAAGGALVSDDYVPMDLATYRPVGFPRAVAAKPGAPIPMGGHHPGRTVEGELAPLVWRRALRAVAPGELAAPIGAVVFCDYLRGDRARLLPVTPEEAVEAASVRVVEAPDGAHVPRNLVARTQSLFLRHGNSAAAASLLLRALA